MVENGIRQRHLQGEAAHEEHSLREVIGSLARLERAVQRIEERLGGGGDPNNRLLDLVEETSSDGSIQGSIQVKASGSTEYPFSTGAGSSASLRKTKHRLLHSATAGQSRSPSKDSVSTTKKILWSNGGQAVMMDPSFAAVLGFQWPQTVRIREGLQGLDSDTEFHDVSGNTLLWTQRTQGDIRLGRRREWPRSLPLNPDSWPVFVVDWVRFFVLLYEIFLTPVVIAWGVESNQTLLTLAWIAAMYWVFDCLLNFSTGFYRDGVDLFMDWNPIARHYMKTWFGPDIFLLSVDWLTIIVYQLGDSGPSEKMRTFLTVARALRGVKILRLGKVVVLLNTIAAGLLSRESAMRAQLLKIPFALIIYNHLVCCVWGLIGRLESEGGEQDSWLRQAELHTEPTANQYLASLHFTFAQMTPGPINITARTNLERIVNCFFLVCGLLYGSIIISQFSGHIMQMTVLQRGKMQKMDSVRSFLTQRNVTRSLATRIQKQVHQRIFEDTPLQFSQVQAFEHLAVPLREELLTEIRLPLLTSHMLFRIWYGVDANEVRSVCVTAVETAVLLQQDQLFSSGAESHQAYMLMRKGELKYIQRPCHALVADIKETPVHRETWFCEAALWSHWLHVGDMEALQASELLVVHADSLVREISMSTPGCQMMQHYAQGFHLRITTAMPPFAPWPTDLSVPYTDLGSLVSTGVGVSLLNGALDQGQIRMSQDAQDTLTDELLAGKCTLQTGHDGSLERIVAVVALRLSNVDDDVLLQVARHDGKSLQAVCSLPAVKRGASELHEAAFQRLMESRFPSLSTSLSVESTQTENVHKESPQFGIPTLYQRTTTVANLEGELDGMRWSRLSVAPCDALNAQTLFRVDDDRSGFHIYAWVAPRVLQTFSDGDESQKAVVTAWLLGLNLAEPGSPGSPGEEPHARGQDDARLHDQVPTPDFRHSSTSFHTQDRPDPKDILVLEELLV
mmetsp:Transcript_70995/g.170072  ORF Transcript_70995/g.170072 Transcript_70995/m.170072 type:complete len:962 (-) Transcript_70995:270-3155(-)|eukprot:CAMPEP_0178384678 /NCGR_PEP_ID=MMETSP0689_2-20121128/7639_1 /TAXON_ID=160604 /ORGANISM="Amphidinium massartii, Strain CS-259" /LENGTH=961 /DNA_ID=CAMNT_0020004933 /DNA_START=44 /DNA_END=2929 /DNA_ORIENTATION=+